MAYIYDIKCKGILKYPNIKFFWSCMQHEGQNTSELIFIFLKKKS